ncbi:hypothetical protein EVAR_94867_1 [Eumeta japonica]|uniref:Uncharacterized protein n=1 Tax=Eumeta variegata TaxID=151549 RepID=A0A4C1V9P9_EUMVA|nr:hypothetical protein EVAR_94867_1 [Eumeta japonica]
MESRSGMYTGLGIGMVIGPPTLPASGTLNDVQVRRPSYEEKIKFEKVSPKYADRGAAIISRERHVFDVRFNTSSVRSMVDFVAAVRWEPRNEEVDERRILLRSHEKGRIKTGTTFVFKELDKGSAASISVIIPDVGATGTGGGFREPNEKVSVELTFGDLSYMCLSGSKRPRTRQITAQVTAPPRADAPRLTLATGRFETPSCHSSARLYCIILD